MLSFHSIEVESSSEVINVEDEGHENHVQCPTNKFKTMQNAGGQNDDEYTFWERMREQVLGREINLGLEGQRLAEGLRRLRNVCLLAMIVLNAIWLVMLTILYYNAEIDLTKMNTYGLIAGIVYGFVLCIQLVGMTIHRIQSLFRLTALKIFGKDKPVWIYQRNAVYR